MIDPHRSNLPTTDLIFDRYLLLWISKRDCLMRRSIEVSMKRKLGRDARPRSSTSTFTTRFRSEEIKSRDHSQIENHSFSASAPRPLVECDPTESVSIAQLVSINNYFNIQFTSETFASSLLFIDENRRLIGLLTNTHFISFHFISTELSYRIMSII